MSSILVGVDGSEESRTALRWAAAVATQIGRPLRVMLAWQYPTDAMLSVGGIRLPSPQQADELTEAELDHLVGEVLGEDAKDVTAEVGRGPAAAALLRTAERGPSMIVVGSRGLGGFRGLLLGSVSRQLCEHATVPVTVVHPTVPTAPIRLDTVLVGTDGSANAARAMLFAADLARRAGAELVVANASGPGDVVHPRGPDRHVDLGARRDLVEEWAQPLRDAGVSYHVAVVTGDARTALLDVAHDRAADLLVVGSRGHGPVTRLLLGSVATSLAQHSVLPITIVPHER